MNKLSILDQFQDALISGTENVTGGGRSKRSSFRCGGGSGSGSSKSKKSKSSKSKKSKSSKSKRTGSGSNGGGCGRPSYCCY